MCENCWCSQWISPKARIMWTALTHSLSNMHVFFYQKHPDYTLLAIWGSVARSRTQWHADWRSWSGVALSLLPVYMEQAVTSSLKPPCPMDIKMSLSLLQRAKERYCRDRAWAVWRLCSHHHVCLHTIETALRHSLWFPLCTVIKKSCLTLRIQLRCQSCITPPELKTTSTFDNLYK